MWHLCIDPAYSSKSNVRLKKNNNNNNKQTKHQTETNEKLKQGKKEGEFWKIPHISENAEGGDMDGWSGDM